MPATEHLFSDPVPDHLYVDTDILISHLVSTQPHHIRCRDFLERLALEGRTTLYISSLTWMEFAHVISRESFRDGLAPRFSVDIASRIGVSPTSDRATWRSCSATLKTCSTSLPGSRCR